MSTALTARMYFAARAPLEIPDWFEVAPLRAAPKLPADKEMSESRPSMHTAWMLQWTDLRKGRVSEGEVDLQVLAFHRKYTEAEAALHAWQVEHDKERFFAWREYYGHQMAARYQPKEGVA